MASCQILIPYIFLSHRFWNKALAIPGYASERRRRPEREKQFKGEGDAPVVDGFGNCSVTKATNTL
jgi:hypothetical protein